MKDKDKAPRKRYIDAKEIYRLTNDGLDIFTHLFPSQDITNPKKHFRIREEKTASAMLSYHKGIYHITDYGDQATISGMQPIPYLILHMGLDYYNALLYVEEVIIKHQVDAGDFKPVSYKADIEFAKPEPDEKPGDYKFTSKTPSPNDLSFIGRYVTADILKRFKGKCIEQYSYVYLKDDKISKIIVTATDSFPIFLFDYGDFKKLYKPMELEKKNRFVWIGKKPKKYIFGLEQIKKAKNEFIVSDEEKAIELPKNKPNAVVKNVFRCSGESDALNLASIDLHPYWLNSETEEFTHTDYAEIDQYCETHYQILDLDYTGQQQAMRLSLKFYRLFNIEIPEWLKLKNDWRGNPCKDLKDFLNIAGNEREDTIYQFLVLKNNARRAKFWFREDEKKDKPSYGINLEYFYFFLKINGFYQMESRYHKGSSYCYVKLNGKVATLISPDKITRIVKRYTKDWIKAKAIMEGIGLLNKINGSNQIAEAKLEAIEEIKLEFKNYDKHTEYLHFKNNTIRITPSKIDTIPHEKIPNYILGSLEMDKRIISHIINRDMRLLAKPPVEVNPTPEFLVLLQQLENATDMNQRETINAHIAQFNEIDKYIVTINDPDFIFLKFLKDLARIHWRNETEKKRELSTIENKEQDLMLANLLFVMGYHGQQYKEEARPWLTFMQDMKISEIGEASGRSGKSVFCKALHFIRSGFYKSGKNFDKNQMQFFYDGLTEFDDLIEIDDLDEHAPFTFFYTQVTGKREVNPKNYAAFTLDYKDSGKMIITSNYELPNMNSSTIARLLNCGVSDYYHQATQANDYRETRSPQSKFGRELFTEFTEEEWIKFYNLSAYAIQMNMRFHKIQPPMLNIMRRQARKTMASGLGRDEIFLNWANDYFQIWPGKPNEKPEFSPEYAGYLNTFINKEDAFKNFCERLSRKQLSDYRSNKFKTHVMAYCDYWEYTFNPIHLCGSDKRRILMTKENMTTEFIYISSANSQIPSTPPSLDIDEKPF